MIDKASSLCYVNHSGISGTDTVLTTRVYTRICSVYNNQSRIAKKAIHNIMAGIVTRTSILSIILPPFKRHTILKVICATYSTMTNIAERARFVNHKLREPAAGFYSNMGGINLYSLNMIILKEILAHGEKNNHA